MDSSGKRAEEFLTLLQRNERGRCKLYIGYAAGVGKTYRMLEEANALKAQGVDVVLAFIETHARVETAALVRDLEVVPRRRVEYRGVVLEDMDLDAVLARRPKVAIVDELAHTNMPGSRNAKRYRDVLELLDAGISVIGAFNIQHLESLNALVSRAAGVSVRETIPDTFLKQADQVISIDLAVEDLVGRLRAGKIYSAAKVDSALQNFFQADNLSMLRELSLREVAESLERTVARSGTKAPKHTVPAGRVMVCLSSHAPRSAAMLYRGSRLAGRLSTDWFVVYVETPGEGPNQIDSEVQRRLLENITKAQELGAEVVKLQGTDPVRCLVDFARSHGVGQIIIGRSQQPWWRQVLGRSVPLRLVREAEGFDLHVVALRESNEDVS